MKKVLKYLLRALAVLAGFLLLLSLGGWIYLKQHKTEILHYIKTESAKRLNGELSIGDISASLFHPFPNVAISLKDIRIRDSLWPQHRHDLLYARKAFASLNIFKLITGQLQLDKITLENASIYIYTDSNGYSNTRVFKKKAPGTRTTDHPDHYPNLEIHNSSLVIEKKNRNKFFSFDISRLLCKIKTNPARPAISLNINLHSTVRNMAFNRDKGSFIEGKTVEGRFIAQFNPDSKILQFEKIRLDIDRQPFMISGKFFLDEVPALFTLSLQTENLPYKKAVSFVTQNIRTKLNQYDISDGINNLKCTLDGTDTTYKTPLIRINISVKNKSIITPITNLDKISFTGSFTNESIKGKGHDDENSLLRFRDMTGEWQAIEFHADSMLIDNLLHPAIKCHIQSRFQLSGLNEILDDKTFTFSKGSGKLDLLYSGPLVDGDAMEKNLDGNFKMDSASFTYLPRNFQMVSGSGKIRFTGKDLFIDNLKVNTGTTDLLMNGSMKNLFSLLDQHPDQVTLDCSVRSNKINLNDFKSFLKKKTSYLSKKKKKLMLSEALSKITHLLETSSMRLNLNSRQLVYKKFSATGLRANMELNNNAINIKQVQLQLAGGSLAAQGALSNEASSNPFSLKAKLSQVDISKIFASFNNFGQEAITDKNILGSLDADINLNGEATEKMQLIPDSSRGQVDFNLKDGQLLQFEPIQKISRTVFKNRDFENIRFADLHDRFIINGNTITINRMEIRSTVMTLFVEGIYNMKKGADLSIQVPLSNLKKNSADAAPENQGIKSKTGVSARLRAKTGDDGKLKVTWDPFKKSIKKTKKNK